MKWLYCFNKQTEKKEDCAIGIECEIFVPGIRGGISFLMNQAVLRKYACDCYSGL